MRLTAHLNIKYICQESVIASFAYVSVFIICVRITVPFFIVHACYLEQELESVKTASA